MYSGIIPALVTPFTADGQVDTAALHLVVDYLLAHKVDGFYVCGSTGEGLLMTEAERCLVAETVVRQVAGRVPVIVHVGALATSTSEHLAAHARAAGADAVAAIPPFYYHIEPEGIAAHYHRIAAACGLPLYLYNIPDATGVSLSARLAGQLHADGVIQGMKFTSYDQLTFREIIETCGPGFNVMAGPDEMLLSFLLMGAHGGIGTTYNCMPGLYKRLFAAWQAGEVAAAQRWQFLADRIILALRPFGVIAATKAALGFMGVACGGPRNPMIPLDDARQDALRTALQEAGFHAAAQEQAR